MEEVFLRLVESLWRVGNAGQTPFSVILIATGEVTASTAGVLALANDDPLAFIDRARERKGPFNPITPLSNESWIHIGAFLWAWRSQRYTLCIIHPNTKGEDIVITGGNVASSLRENVDASAAALAALHEHNPEQPLNYIVPEYHQIKNTA